MSALTESFPATAYVGPGHQSVRADRHAASGPSARVAALVDTAVALSVLAAVVLLPQLDYLPDGIEAALSMRVTVRNLLLVGTLAAAWPLVFLAWGLYAPRRRSTDGGETRAVCGACATGALLTAAVGTLSASGGLRPTDYALFWLWTTAAALFVRKMGRLLAQRSSQTGVRRVLIVGSGPLAERMWKTLSLDATASYVLAGLCDTPSNSPLSEAVAARLLGPLDDLEATLMRHAVDEVWIGLPVKSHYLEIQRALHVCERVGIRTKYDADLFQTEVAWPRYDGVGSPMVTMHVVPDDGRLLVKRFLDIVGATAALALLSPVLLAIAIAVKVSSPGPVFFAQERCGLNRRRFRMLKFRTMVAGAAALQATLEDANEADGPVFKISNDPRITRIGRVLRRTSLDEFPQFINVLRGEMSLVGPRPLPLRDVERFACAADLRRFSIRPGLTCLWQISGRSTLSFGEWVRLDLKYIDSWSLALDFMILFRTLPAVIRGTGAQ